VEKVSAINLKRTVQAIIERNPILKEIIKTGVIGIVGGTHNITTGDVSFYDDTLIIHDTKPFSPIVPNKTTQAERMVTFPAQD
jgi:carbonic anhydrase